MDVFERLFRRTKATVILMGVALLVLGVAMFVSPIGATLLIVQFVGWTLAVAGAITLLNCWRHASEGMRQATCSWACSRPSRACASSCGPTRSWPWST